MDLILNSNIVTAVPPPPPPQGRLGQSSSPSPIESIGRGSPSVVQVNDLEQSEWLADLHARNAKIVRVLFPRTANNDKELTVVRYVPNRVLIVTLVHTLRHL